MNLQYSIDGGQTWLDYTWNGRTGQELNGSATAGVWMKGNNPSFNKSDSHRFKIVLGSGTYRFDVYGNIMTLLDEYGKLNEVPNSCFAFMFQGCTNLYNVKDLILPAKYVGAGGYDHMFSGCSNLTTMPRIAATDFNKSACNGMFTECSNLTSAKISIPNIWKKTINDWNSGWQSDDAPFIQMFNGCSSLSSLEVSFNEWPIFSQTDKSSWKFPVTKDWLNNVAASGQLICPYSLDTTTRDASHIPAGWSIVYQDVPEDIIPAEQNPVNISLEMKTATTAGTFTGSFEGKQIQKWVHTDATSGSITIDVASFSSTATDIAPTTELHVPINGNVSTITTASSLSIIDIPDTLEYKGETTNDIQYEVFVIRAVKDMNGAWKFYINYAYSYIETISA